MSLLNAALRAVFDVALGPFAALPPIVPVTIVALVSGIFALLVYRWTSNQAAIAAVKRRLFGHLLEVRLFNDDLRAVLAAQLRLLRENLTYLRLNLVPLLWMIVPFMLLIAQLQFHYGYDGLEVGERTLLVVDLAPAEPAAAGGDQTAPRPPVELEAPAGVAAETAGVWVPSLRQVVWRLRADEPGRHELVVRVDGGEFTKSLFVADPEGGASWVRRSPTRRRAAILDQLLYPAEPSLPRGGPIERIDVQYGTAAISFFGLFDVHWLIAFLILSLAFAFALRNRFGVTL
ncbi:MAG: hypothetical protein OYL92_03660 [Acidobacteriota bacterium]|nr:hypothetical protein [Acidobacteriota bacterium]MDE2924396.1 hypothetical protein [Acidobacteriota bacterium]MDE3264046.1 hypothetical protein [Acidobacteriota bacterium]